MEFAIGIKDTARDLSVSMDVSPDELAEMIKNAVDEESTLDLTDTKGRRYLVPANNIAYVEFRNEAPRRIGFGQL